LALGKVRIIAEQGRRNDHAEYGITQELEAFISGQATAIIRVRAVRQCETKQIGVNLHTERAGEMRDALLYVQWPTPSVMAVWHVACRPGSDVDDLAALIGTAYSTRGVWQRFGTATRTSGESRCRGLPLGTAASRVGPRHTA